MNSANGNVIFVVILNVVCDLGVLSMFKLFRRQHISRCTSCVGVHLVLLAWLCFQVFSDMLFMIHFLMTFNDRCLITELHFVYVDSKFF